MIDDPRALAARLLAASPLAMPLEDALKQKRTRQAALLAAPPTAATQVDFTAPGPLPVLDAPESFAKDFWSTRRPLDPKDEPPKPKPKKQRGRKPVGDLPPGANRFRVIDGDDGDNKS